MQHALIFANGDVNDGSMVQRALAEASATSVPSVVIAADGGARVARYFGARIDRVIGDLDSLSREDVERLRAEGVTIDQYPVHKNETDLELCLLWAAAQGVGWIRVIGGLGDRLDQTLGNIYLLALPALVACDVMLVAGKQATRLLRPGTHEIRGKVGDTVSLLPMGGAAHGIRTEHFEYPLNDETLHFGPARGISNVLMQPHGRITLRDGLLLLVHTVGRA